MRKDSTRRLIFSRAALAAGLALSFAAPALAQRPPGPLILTTHPLREGAYWITGGEANSGFVVGDKGVIVYDVQFGVEDGRKILAEIAKVTTKPVNEILLSHADPDHVAGLPAFPRGTPIIAQENVTPIIEASIRKASNSPIGPMYQALADYLPTTLVGDELDRTDDGVRMELIHVAPAHTAADLVLYLPSARIVFAGDLLASSFEYPVIHNGGTSLGWIDSMKKILALDADIYVPGHGAIEAKPLLQQRLEKVIRRRDAIRALVERHMSLEEVERALPEKQTDPRFATFTQGVYRELTEGYPQATPPWETLLQP